MSAATHLAVALVLGASSVLPIGVVDVSATRRCDQAVTRDRSGDGPIDIATIRIESDCTEYRFVLTTHGPFTDSELRRWGVAIGPITPRSTTGQTCDGMTALIAVDGSSSGLDADLLRLVGCRSFSSGSVAVERLSDRSIAVTVSASRLSGDSTPFVGFRWQSITQSVSGGTTDWAPSFAVAAIQPPFAPRLALRSSPDGTSVRVNWWANKANLTYTEVRYRQVGAAWSPVRRVGHQIRSLDLDDVVPGKRYGVSIVLVSPGGRSRAVTKSLLHLAPPSAPRNLNVTAYRGFLAVTFDRPASSGGHRDLNWYAVAWSDAGNVYDLEQTPDGRTLYFVDTPTLPITLGVRAFTDRGHGEWAAVRITEMPPGVERGAG